VRLASTQVEVSYAGRTHRVEVYVTTTVPVVHVFSRWERTALAGGIAFGALQLLAMVGFGVFILPKLGPVGAPAVERAAAYAEHGDLLRLGNYLLVLPTALFLLCLGGLHGVLRRAEGGSGAFTVAGLLAATAMAMLWPLAAIVSDVGIDIAQAGGDVVTVAALDAIAPYSLALSAVPRTVFLLTVSVVLISSRVVARWIGWLGVGAGVISLLGTGTLVNTSLFPLLGLSTVVFELWIIALCIALMRSSQSTELASAPAAAHASILKTEPPPSVRQ
jgi:hypothetical protein